jgi:hypothetical protein
MLILCGDIPYFRIKYLFSIHYTRIFLIYNTFDLMKYNRGTICHRQAERTSCLNVSAEMPTRVSMFFI